MCSVGTPAKLSQPSISCSCLSPNVLASRCGPRITFPSQPQRGFQHHLRPDAKLPSNRDDVSDVRTCPIFFCATMDRMVAQNTQLKILRSILFNSHCTLCESATHTVLTQAANSSTQHFHQRFRRAHWPFNLLPTYSLWRPSPSRTCQLGISAPAQVNPARIQSIPRMQDQSSRVNNLVCTNSVRPTSHGRSVIFPVIAVCVVTNVRPKPETTDPSSPLEAHSLTSLDREAFQILGRMTAMSPKQDSLSSGTCCPPAPKATMGASHPTTRLGSESKSESSSA